MEWTFTKDALPIHSYTLPFWLYVIDDDGYHQTVIGRWSAWQGEDKNIFNAFTCYKDTLINGHIYQISQPIPMEQVVAWCPAPEPPKIFST